MMEKQQELRLASPPRRRTSLSTAAKKAIVAFIRGHIAWQVEENAVAEWGRRSAWTGYNRRELTALRRLAREVKALPDDDERLRRIAARLHGTDLSCVLKRGEDELRELLDPPGPHPYADPADGLPGVDGLLERVEKLVAEYLVAMSRSA